MVIAVILTSCGTTTSTSTTSSITTSTQTSITTSVTTSSTVQTSTSNTTTAVVSTTVTSTGNWWDTLGTPIYGGTITERWAVSPTTWDPYDGTAGTVGPAGLQSLVQADYTLNPSIWDIAETGFPAPQYFIGELATSFEMPNSYSMVFQLRQDVYWWNIAPANGRQFVASDVVDHFDRCLGLGNGYTVPSAWWAGQSAYKPLLSVVATGNFTVTFTFQQGTNPYTILNTMMSANLNACYENPESVTAYGNLENWHHALGTGPYFTTDYVSDSSITEVANPNYYETDLRYPGNKFPYITTRIILIIPSNPTAEAAMRVGKIDVYASMPTQDALNMEKTNPDLVVKNAFPRNELTIDPNDQAAPFNDINVRIAMQHAIDSHLIASTIYEGYADPDPAGMSQNQMTGSPYYPYPTWPQSLKDTYAYNPTLAKQMLATAGYPNGFSTSCILENDCNMDLWAVVQSELASVGINMSITTMDPASWQNYILTARKLTALCARPQGQTGQSTNPLTMMVLCTTGYNIDYININNPQIDTWYANANTAQSIDQVFQITNQFLQYYATQHYAISLVEPLLFNLEVPWIGGAQSVSLLGVKSDPATICGDEVWINSH